MHKGRELQAFHAANRLKKQLSAKLKQLKEEGTNIDVITFSGNGEPTLHPRIQGHSTRRDHTTQPLFPEAKVCVLSNATMASRLHVAEALKMVDSQYPEARFGHLRHIQAT